MHVAIVNNIIVIINFMPIICKYIAVNIAYVDNLVVNDLEDHASVSPV